MRIGPRGGGIVGLLVVLAVIAINDRAPEERREEGASARTAGERVRADVVRVVDGDTIEVELDGRVEDVRYIGIDTPETVKPGTPVECFGKEASAANTRLVEGRHVLLEFDRELRDRYGRLLAYVYAGNQLVNAELVRGGYARTLEIEPNTAEADSLARLEAKAGARRRGLWSRC
jgi:micrococcal nuclease